MIKHFLNSDIKKSSCLRHLRLFNYAVTNNCNCKSSAMDDALCTFDDISPLYSNPIRCNLMISSYNKRMEYDASFRVFHWMHSSGFEFNRITYGSILAACSSSLSLQFGKQIFSFSIKNGFSLDDYVCTGMIDLFSKSGRYEDALRLFSEVSRENVVCWNAIIAGAIRNNENRIALDLFYQMAGTKLVVPNDFTFSSILKACTALRELEIGKGIHGWVIKSGFLDDIYVGTSIIDLYAKCSNINEAVQAFSLMPERNVASWTAIISSYVQTADFFNALKFMKEMIQSGVDLNEYTITSMLTACAIAAMANVAAQVHCLIFKIGFVMAPAVKDSLINMYARIGEVCSAEKIFEDVGCFKDVSTWAVMISGFAQNDDFTRSVELFTRMVREGWRPDAFCYSSVLSCINCLFLGKLMHSQVLKAGLILDVSVSCALFTMYSKCDSLDDSYQVFKQIPEKDEASWTSMVAGFAEHGFADKAFILFKDMISEQVKPDHVTLSSILMACSLLQSLKKGKEIHGYALRLGFESEALLCGALVNMYSKVKALVFARQIFDSMPRKDQISWSSMIAGYAQNGHIDDAFLQYRQMLFDGLKIDFFVISSILSASATLARVGLGKQLHSQSIKVGLDFDASVSSSLITMYSKCGNIDDSRKVFEQVDNPDLVTWTTMINGYGQHGQGIEALEMYHMMIEEGIQPDSVTFVGILSACSHNGMVKEAYAHLNSMKEIYGIAPESCHYACMVDLLGRSGRLEEATNFIQNMPIKSDTFIWGILLGACRVHGNVEIGRLAARKVLELEPSDSGAFISLSNLYADVGDWAKVLKIRSSMSSIGVRKELGWSQL